MRATFLTGSLEAGKDGVGDYTRLLAGEMRRRGHSVNVIALADRGVDAVVREDADVLRLPLGRPWRERGRTVQRELVRTSPEWVSLQFVPYSFHRRGIAIRAARLWPRWTAHARRHVMLHEIWTGGDGSWRSRIVEAAQRRVVLSLCRQPGTLVHTSNHTYRRMLETHGIAALALPLFGSIPVDEDRKEVDDVLLRLEASGCENIRARRSTWWVAAMFGTLHPVWPSEPLLTRLETVAHSAGRRLALVSVGRLGSGEPLWREMYARYCGRIPMLRLGPQPPARVSATLRAADFGIATGPYGLLGKSATVTALLEHGLPVIVNREDGPPAVPDDFDPADAMQIIRLDEAFAYRVQNAAKRGALHRLPGVASRLLSEFGNHGCAPGAAAAAVV